MKLRNKKTGKILDGIDIVVNGEFAGDWTAYPSIAKLNEEWEDYEEPEPLTTEPTAWGFTQHQLEFVEKLDEAGITPYELKDHMHDFEWVAKILKDDLNKQLEQAVRNAVGDYGTMKIKYEGNIGEAKS